MQKLDDSWARLAGPQGAYLHSLSSAVVDTRPVHDDMIVNEIISHLGDSIKARRVQKNQCCAPESICMGSLVLVIALVALSSPSATVASSDVHLKTRATSWNHSGERAEEMDVRSFVAK